jgi:hypothetical protein
MANILNYTRVTRNEEKSILITLGISFKQMIAEWQNYYGEMEASVAKTYVEPDEANRFVEHHNRTTEFTTAKLSPDGRYLAYAENDRGHYTIKVRILESGKEKIILSGGSKVINQRVDYRQPLISWSDANTLGVIGVKHGEYVLWLYDLSTNTKQPRALEKFSNVRSFRFSHNGRLIILSADFDGKSDLFLLSTRRDRVKRLTNDLYDDLDPSFIPNTNRIIFSSNRTHDTLRAAAKPEFEKLNNNYNLFVYDLDSANMMLKRVTNTLSKDVMPLAYDENNFYYLSDQRGIVNLFKYDQSTGIYSQVTHFSSSIKDFDLNFDNQMLATIMMNRQRQSIYIDRKFDINQKVFTPTTRRKELQQARIIRERRKQEENKNMSVRDLVNARKKQAESEKDSVVTKDSVTVPLDTMHVDSVAKAPVEVKKQETVNTDNYVFEDEAVKQTQPTESILTRFVKARDKSRIAGPFPYESRFSADNLVTSLVIDPLRGLGVQIESQMNDMLENYKFYGGLMAPIDLRGGDFFAEFQYLPKLIDFSVRFDRKAIRWEAFPQPEGFSFEYKYTLHRFEVGASLPISDRFRVSVKPFASVARSIDLGVSNQPTTPDPAKPLTNYYGGAKLELVYDNSVSTGLNLIEGTRGKIFIQHHQGLNDGELSFSQASADIRHYQKIYREIVLAVRGYGGSFFGKSPKIYMLGGMDNWLFNESRYTGVTSNGQKNPLGESGMNQDLLFAEYATSLRGFEYSTLFGNNVLLFNAELRIPLVRAFSTGPISSNFFRNMQLTAFYDIGTSWSGKPPFSSGNSVSYEIIQDGPFQAEIKNYLNPWLYSYGFGLRSMMLGYYMKFDLAWPVENYKVLEPRLFVTLGFDF